MSSIAERLAAAEPADGRPLADLLERLQGEGRLRDGAGGAHGAAGGAHGSVVRGLAFDSRQVVQGALFVAIPGEHADGHAYVAAAARAGAVAAIVERPVEAPISQLVVDHPRRALASAAAWWYGDPSRELGVIGITGTDGKTTTSFLAVAALEAAGISAGLLGTAALEIGDTREPNTEHATTPAAPRLQALLRAMVPAGDRAAVVETPSHGLAQERVAGIAYDIARVTNLSHEHLEFHGSFEAYRAAKVSLFERLAEGPGNPAKAGVAWPRTGIVNVDDPAAEAFAAATRAAGARLLTYGRATGADIRLMAVAEEEGRLRVDYATDDGPVTLRLRLAGRFTAHNALAVVALGRAIGLDASPVRRGMEALPAVPGRMERIEAGQPFTVVVDYAHSPASLTLVLDELGAALAPGGSLIAVFGSAGERDVEKRPMMGRIAAERCRLVVITDEDPRGEDAEAILREIGAGAEAAGRAIGKDVLLIADRRLAIREALAAARPGDSVLLAGKGHEATILYADHAEPWDEAAEARSALAELGYAGGRPA